MGLLPSVATFFNLCTSYFLLAIPVWRFGNTKNQEAQTRSRHCCFTLSLMVQYVTENLYNLYSLSVTHSLDWLILLVRLFSSVENTACFYPEPYLPFYLGSILASFYIGPRTQSICFCSCPYSNTDVQLLSLGYCYSHKQMSLIPTADAFRSFPFAWCLVSSLCQYSVHAMSLKAYICHPEGPISERENSESSHSLMRCCPENSRALSSSVHAGRRWLAGCPRQSSLEENNIVVLGSRPEY